MKYHIVLSRRFDLEEIAQNAQAGECPRHVMWDISQVLGATIHQPGNDAISPLDRILAQVVSCPEQWALARKLSSQLGADDVIFCAGEDVGFPLATLCGGKRNGAKIVLFIHYIDRLRVRAALKLFGLRDRIDVFMINTRAKADFLRHSLRLPEHQVCLFAEQHTDIAFFTPGSALANQSRPVIGSGGLEQRDYRTLAEATKDLDVDVKICAVSPNATASSRNFPEVLLSNMSCRAYDWRELLQLYRDSDVFVISLLEHNYQAGLTTLFEAMACRRPVVMTRTPGLVENLIDSGIVTGVNPGEPVGMKQVLVSLLNDRQKAQAQAQRGYELILKEHNHNKYVEAFVTQLTSKYGRW